MTSTNEYFNIINLQAYYVVYYTEVTAPHKILYVCCFNQVIDFKQKFS